MAPAGTPGGAGTGGGSVADVSDTDVVRTLLETQGLELPDEDLAALVRQYPAMRRRMERMYAIDATDEVTAAVVRADDVRSDR